MKTSVYTLVRDSIIIPKPTTIFTNIPMCETLFSRKRKRKQLRHDT